MFLHVSILTLLRPLAYGDRRDMKLSGFASPHATPAAAYDASLRQPGRLVSIFADSFACAAYAVLWHPALLHVANAALREAATAIASTPGTSIPSAAAMLAVVGPSPPAAFRLCLAGYLDLGRGFAVARSVLKALLAMAVRGGVVEAADARRVVEAMLQGQAPHGAGPARPLKAGGEPETLVVDLDLALSDVLAARIGAVARQFDIMIEGLDALSAMNISKD